MTKSTAGYGVVGCKPVLENSSEDKYQRNYLLSYQKTTKTTQETPSTHVVKDYNLPNNHFNIRNQLRLKQALINELSVGYGFNFAITLTFNRKMSHADARKKLNSWAHRLNQKLYGKKNKLQSVFYYAFPQKVDTNYHYHLLFRVEKDLMLKVLQHSSNIWKKLVRSSTHHINPLLSDKEQTAWVVYVTDELWDRLNWEEFVISGE